MINIRGVDQVTTVGVNRFAWSESRDIREFQLGEGHCLMLNNVRSKMAKFCHLCTDDFLPVPTPSVSPKRACWNLAQWNPVE